MKYVIVQRTYKLGCKAYYCETLEEAKAERQRLIMQSACEDSEYFDWVIYQNVEHIAISKFWSWLTRRAEYLYERTNW